MRRDELTMGCLLVLVLAILATAVHVSLSPHRTTASRARRNRAIPQIILGGVTPRILVEREADDHVLGIEVPAPH